MSPRTGRVGLGILLVALGASSLGLGVLRPDALPGAPGIPAAALAVSVGIAFVIPGLILALFSFRRPVEQVALVPAHVAFVRRAPVPDALPERPVIPVRRPSTRSPEEQAAIALLDEEIRELTRQINRAGVLLATGQISHQGYTSYVEDLKKKRGDLEVSRVRIEINRIK